MDFVYLQTFCEVAKWRNFTRAAEMLGYAQSSVTTQIKKLEEQYNVLLFERTGRTIRLTQAGEVLLPYAQKILTLQAEVKTLLSNQETGSLVLGTIETLATFYLPPLLQTFRQTYPRMTITLQSGSDASLIQSVRDGVCDLSLFLDVPCTDHDLHCTLLRKETFVIVVHPESVYRHYDELAPSDLAHAQFLLTEKGCTYRLALERQLEEVAVPYQVVTEFSSVEAIKQCVRIGMGIAFLPRMAVQTEVEQGVLRAIPLVSPTELYTQIVYRKEGWRSHAFQDLLALVLLQISQKD